MLDTLRIVGSQNSWFGDPRPLLYQHPNPSSQGNANIVVVISEAKVFLKFKSMYHHQTMEKPPYGETSTITDGTTKQKGSSMYL